MSFTFGFCGSAQNQLANQKCPNVKRSTRSFTENFHQNVAVTFANTNFVSSALSAHVVLAMAAYGADGANKAEIKRVLHLPDSDEVAYQEFEYFTNALRNVQNVTLKIANKIYTSNVLQIKDRYKEITRTHFNSECTALNFENSNAVASTINQWCSLMTNGKINDIISPANINSDLKMILLNAIYFKGEWLNKFNEGATRLRSFHTDNTSTLNVPIMHMRNKFFYKSLPEVDARFVALPYKNSDFSMVIILPNQIDGLKKLEENLDKVDIDYDNHEFYSKTEVILALPKFRIENTIELNGILGRLGMTQMFINGYNFNVISDEPLKVDRVIQKAFIEVNEEGSEAAAVTATMMMFAGPPQRKLPPVEFIVDRPFLYQIVWNGVPLFSGHVYNPMR